MGIKLNSKAWSKFPTHNVQRNFRKKEENTGFYKYATNQKWLWFEVEISNPCIALQKTFNFVLSQEVENALFSQNPISFDFLSILVLSASAALPLSTWKTSVDVNLCLSNIPGIVAPWFGEVKSYSKRQIE